MLFYDTENVSLKVPKIKCNGCYLSQIAGTQVTFYMQLLVINYNMNLVKKNVGCDCRYIQSELIFDFET